MNRIFFPLAVVFFSSFLHAQQPSPTPEETPLNRRVWKAEMPGGTYTVALSAITSVSSHEYVVDNTARVTEVTVGTIGSVLARFYFIEPNTPQTPNGIGQSTIDFMQQKLTDAAERTGTDSWKKVVKNYPTTTHAHTVEYRVETKETLEKLRQSLETSWFRGRGETFKP